MSLSNRSHSRQNRTTHREYRRPVTVVADADFTEVVDKLEDACGVRPAPAHERITAWRLWHNGSTSSAAAESTYNIDKGRWLESMSADSLSALGPATHTDRPLDVCSVESQSSRSQAVYVRGLRERRIVRPELWPQVIHHHEEHVARPRRRRERRRNLSAGCRPPSSR